MAWTITVDKFLWVTDLYIGAWIYGGIQAVIVIYSLFVNNLGWGGWIYMILAAIPMMVTWIYMLAKMNDDKLWFYVWINWYFTFFAFCLGSLQTVIQTILLSVMISKAGKRNILYPESPEDLFSNDQMAMQGYKALPRRFQEVIAFFHDEADADSYEAPEIYGARARSTMGWIMFAIWLAYGCMMYFTLVNYSYWKKIHAEAVAGGKLDRTLA